MKKLIITLVFAVFMITACSTNTQQSNTTPAPAPKPEIETPSIATDNPVTEAEEVPITTPEVEPMPQKTNKPKAIEPQKPKENIEPKETKKSKPKETQKIKPTATPFKSPKKDYIKEHVDGNKEIKGYSQYEGKKLKELMNTGIIPVATQMDPDGTAALIFASPTSEILIDVTFTDIKGSAKIIEKYKSDIKKAAENLKEFKINSIESNSITETPIIESTK